MVGQHRERVPECRQSTRRPIIETADIDGDGGEVAAKNGDRGGAAPPRPNLRVAEFLPSREARYARAVGADDRGRGRREMPVAAKAQTGLVLAIDDAALVPVPVEPAFVLDPLARDAGDHRLARHELAVLRPLGSAMIGGGRDDAARLLRA